MRLVDLVTFPRPAAQHLSKEDARSHGAQENQVFDLRDVYPGSQHVDGYRDCWKRTVPELSDSLEWSVNGGVPSDFLNEGIPPPKFVPKHLNEPVRMGHMRHIVHRKNQGLGKMPDL